MRICSKSKMFLEGFMTLVIVQFLVVLLALYVGSRYGSIALGAISGIGLVILVFAFHLKPGTPPPLLLFISSLPPLLAPEFYRLQAEWIS